MSYWKAKDIRYARALQNHKDWESSENLMRMRRMARDGATAREIADELGWNVGYEMIRKRLKKYNIVVPFSRAKHIQRFRLTGRDPYLAPHDACTSQTSYRPKDVRSL